MSLVSKIQIFHTQPWELSPKLFARFKKRLAISVYASPVDMKLADEFVKLSLRAWWLLHCWAFQQRKHINNVVKSQTWTTLYFRCLQYLDHESRPYIIENQTWNTSASGQFLTLNCSSWPKLHPQKKSPLIVQLAIEYLSDIFSINIKYSIQVQPPISKLHRSNIEHVLLCHFQCLFLFTQIELGRNKLIHFLNKY